MFEVIGFYFFAATSLGLFAISVFSNNIIYAMTSLAAGMILVSGLFFLLGAEFLGVVQIMVYTGAVMVLYGFSMMFFDTSKPVKEDKKTYKIIYTLGVFCALLFVIIFASPVVAKNMRLNYKFVEGLDNIENIGVLIFTKYLVVFELVALMLLVAMICGIVLAHKNMDKSLTLEEE